MGLSIRSQDKLKLVKVNYVYAIESNNHYTIYGETIDSGPIIGTYKTKKRALAVLDEIQKFIENDGTYVKVTDYKINEHLSKVHTEKKRVYEMPQD